MSTLSRVRAGAAGAAIVAMAAGVSAAVTPIVVHVEGADGAPAWFRGYYPLSISEITTVTVPTAGVYHLSGSLSLYRYVGYAAEPMG